MILSLGVSGVLLSLAIPLFLPKLIVLNSSSSVVVLRENGLILHVRKALYLPIFELHSNLL